MGGEGRCWGSGEVGMRLGWVWNGRVCVLVLIFMFQWGLLSREE
jgi:hypothetical protein